MLLLAAKHHEPLIYLYHQDCPKPKMSKQLSPHILEIVDVERLDEKKKKRYSIKANVINLPHCTS